MAVLFYTEVLFLHPFHTLTPLLSAFVLPFNDGSFNSHNDFLIALGELEGFIDRHIFDHLLIAGDFNVDFIRESINLHHLHNFLSDLNLVVAGLPFHSSIHFTYRRGDGCVTSWPDHFLRDTSLCSDLSAFGCSDFGANLSDHLPLSCSLRVDISSSSPPPVPAPTVKFRIAWHAATPDQFVSYCNMVSSQLLPFPVSIRDCCDPSVLLWIAFVISSSSALMIQLSLHCPELIGAPPLLAGT